MEYNYTKTGKKIVDELRKEQKLCSKIILACDRDREGEAIAWHLAQVLQIPLNERNRIVFQEVTPESIKNALQNPRPIDLNIVNSQKVGN